MGASVDHLQAHPKTGRLSYRRVYPAELRPFITGNPTELKRSLGAKHIGAAGALDRFNAAAAEYDRNVAIARKALVRAFDNLDPPQIAWLTAIYRTERLEADQARRFEGSPADIESLEAGIDVYEGLYQDSNPTRIVDIFGEDASALSVRHGLLIDPDSPDFVRLCFALLEAEMSLTDVRMARSSGKPVATEDVAPRPAPLVPSAKATKGPSEDSFPTIVERLLTNITDPISGTTQQGTRTALRFWRETHGELKPSEIKRHHVTQYIEMLLQRPARLPSSEQGLSIGKVIEKYQGRDVPRLSGKTINQHIGMLGSAWNKAHSRGDIDEALSANPFARRKVDEGPAPESNPELSKTELEALFALPIFTRGERPKQGRGEAVYWLPLMLLWTGARPEEVAQLTLSDFRFDDERQRWVMRITDTEMHEHKGRRTLKTQSKGTGRRTFPVPMPLIELGLIDYIQWLRDHGETTLFPKLRTKSERGTIFDSFSRWFVPHLKAQGIISEGSRRPMREFRHNWTTEARKVGMPEDAREFIQGHSVAGKSANVAYGDRSVLGDQIDRIKFAGVDLSKVQRWVRPS